MTIASSGFRMLNKIIIVQEYIILSGFFSDILILAEPAKW